jgi:hypothetical protein
LTADEANALLAEMEGRLAVLQAEASATERVIDERRQKRERAEAELAERAIDDAVRAVARKAGAAPNRIDVLVDHLQQRKLVSKADDGALVLQVGSAKKPLEAGLREFLR